MNIVNALRHLKGHILTIKYKYIYPMAVYPMDRLRQAWRERRWLRLTALTLVGTMLMTLLSMGLNGPTQAQLPLLGNPRVTDRYCHLNDGAVSEKTALRQAAFAGDDAAQSAYNAKVEDHAQVMNDCRRRNWPRNQAIWVRLYPCDVQAGKLEELFDEFVDLGYNQVYVEAFYNGQVLLPQAGNDTRWPSVIRQPGYENRDLLAEAIDIGHERGLKVYAWMFSMNFGHSYASQADRQNTLAKNGRGQTSISMYEMASLDPNLTFTPPDEAFIDPYNRQAKIDYYAMAQKVLARRPDGALFDYIRYPVGLGSELVANSVEDLWIYGDAARQALVDRALNSSGRQLIQQFLDNGYITAATVESLVEEPLWQGRTPFGDGDELSTEQKRSRLQADLWDLAVAHATQGVLDFLNVAALAAERQQLPAGAVFFPEGNRTLHDGYDSRLQPWDRFPSNLEWHPMAYGICGDASCITSKVNRVVDSANGANVKPVLAGVWGRPMTNRPSLEVQMQDIRQSAPHIDTISHFAYSWQRPDRAQERQFCRL